MSAQVHQISRRRVSYSCRACRRRKVRCDKSRPTCASCRRSGGVCTFDALSGPADLTPVTKDAREPDQLCGASSALSNNRKRPLRLGIHSDFVIRKSPSATSDSDEDEDDDTGDVGMAEYDFSDLDNLVLDEQFQLTRPTDCGAEEGSIDRPKRFRPDHRQGPSTTSPTGLRPISDLLNSHRPHSTTFSFHSRPRLLARRVTDPTGDKLFHQAEGTVRRPWPEWSPEAVSQTQDNRSPLRSKYGKARRTLGHPSIRPPVRWSPALAMISPDDFAYATHRKPDISEFQGTEQRWDSPLMATSLAGAVPAERFLISGINGTTNRKQTSVHGLDLLLRDLPSKQLSDSLYRSYVAGVHPLMPILHLPSTLADYNTFWMRLDHHSDPESSSATIKFLPLLYAILYSGSMSSQNTETMDDLQQISNSALSAELYDRASNCLDIVSFPQQPSLPWLIAFLILQTVAMEEPQPEASFIGVAIRVGQVMGLHKDPASLNLHPCTAEVRRRVWWHILYLDALISANTGLPPLVNEERFCNVRDLSELQDCYVERAEGNHSQQSGLSATSRPDSLGNNPAITPPSTLSVIYLAARGKYLVTNFEKEFLRISLGVVPLTRNDLASVEADLHGLETRLKEQIRRISAGVLPEVRYKSDISSETNLGMADRQSLRMAADGVPIFSLQVTRETTPLDNISGQASFRHRNTILAFKSWATTATALMIEKVHCFIYQPFLNDARSQTWLSIRHRALAHCYKFCRKLFHLVTTPEFRAFHWSLPASQLPIYATWIMLVDLCAHPNSSEAPRSRAFLEQLFTLCESEVNPMIYNHTLLAQRLQFEGRVEAWNLLHRLRRTARGKADLITESVNLNDGAETKVEEVFPHDKEHDTESEPVMKPKSWEAFRDEVTHSHIGGGAGGAPRSRSTNVSGAFDFFQHRTTTQIPNRHRRSSNEAQQYCSPAMRSTRFSDATTSATDRHISDRSADPTQTTASATALADAFLDLYQSNSLGENDDCDRINGILPPGEASLGLSATLPPQQQPLTLSGHAEETNPSRIFFMGNEAGDDGDIDAFCGLTSLFGAPDAVADLLEDDEQGLP